MVADPHDERYGRQVLFPPIGIEGQRRLLGRRVSLVGCGALGASLGELMARSGVGQIRLIDRDVVERSNLGRQALYTEEDAIQGLPKAAALKAKLETFNPTIEIEARVSDLNPTTIHALLDGSHVVLDGSDNFETRYLINDWSLSTKTPWIYGACVASRGLTANILPGETPCLRCLFPEPPAAGTSETCDTSGIIAPAATVIASLQAAEALKILAGKPEVARRTLLSLELWPFRMLELGGSKASPRDDCPACAQGELRYLLAKDRVRMLAYCGRNAVQVVPVLKDRVFDLDAVETRLAQSCKVVRNDYVLKVVVSEQISMTIFDDGRALISGTGEEDRARALYDRYVGS